MHERAPVCLFIYHAISLEITDNEELISELEISSGHGQHLVNFVKWSDAVYISQVAKSGPSCSQLFCAWPQPLSVLFFLLEWLTFPLLNWSYRTVVNARLPLGIKSPCHRNLVELLKCSVCIKFQDKLCCMRNFNPGFINGSRNLKRPATRITRPVTCTMLLLKKNLHCQSWTRSEYQSFSCSWF